MYICTIYLPDDVLMSKMAFAPVGLAIAIAGVSPVSASVKATVFNDVAVAKLHLMFTEPGAVIAGTVAEIEK